MYIPFPACVDDVSSVKRNADSLTVVVDSVVVVVVVVVEVVVTIAVSGPTVQTTTYQISIKIEQDAPLYRSNNLQ